MKTSKRDRKKKIQVSLAYGISKLINSDGLSRLYYNMKEKDEIVRSFYRFAYYVAYVVLKYYNGYRFTRYLSTDRLHNNVCKEKDEDKENVAEKVEREIKY